MHLGIINEVMRDHRICMLPTAFQTVRNLVLHNIDSRTASVQMEKLPISERVLLSVQSVAQVEDNQPAEPIDHEPQQQPAATDDNAFIHLVHLQGPMTRGGAECSYGSREMRDAIIDAADDPACRGHILLTDTPGGMCSCLPDFRMAINYAHQCGQKVYMLIDGIAASAGAFVGAMCDGIYYTNVKDEIGSIGMYAAFFTLADGAENKITSEVYHEYYAKASVDKNAWMRQAAEGNTKQLQAEIDSDLDALIADLSADRPSILDEQKTGKMYPVAEVAGSLVDGQSSLSDLAAQLLTDYAARNGEPLAPKNGAVLGSTDEEAKCNPDEDEDSKCNPDKKKDCECNPEEDEDSKCNPDKKKDCECNPDEDEDSKCNPDEDEDSKCNPDKKKDCEGAKAPSEPQQSTQHNHQMKQYPTISAALQMGDAIMESDVDNQLTLQSEEADAIEAMLNDRNAQIVALTEQLTAARQAQQEAEANATAAAELVATAQQAQQEAENALANAQQEIAEARQAAEQSLAEAQQMLADAQANAEAVAENHRVAIEALNEQIERANQQTADQQQTIADLRSENDRLASGQGAPVQAGAQPQADANPMPQKARILSKAETAELVKQQFGI